MHPEQIQNQIPKKPLEKVSVSPEAISDSEKVKIREKLHEKFLMDNIQRNSPFGEIYNGEISEGAAIYESEKYLIDAAKSFLPPKAQEDMELISEIVNSEVEIVKDRIKSGMTLDAMIQEINDKNFEPKICALGISMEILQDVREYGIQSEEAMEQLILEFIERKLPDQLSMRDKIKSDVASMVMDNLADINLLQKEVDELGNSKYIKLLEEIARADKALKKVRENTENETKARRAKFKVVPKVVKDKMVEVKSDSANREIVNIDSQIGTLVDYIKELQNEIKKDKKEIKRLNKWWRRYNPFSSKAELERNNQTKLEAIRQMEDTIKKLEKEKEKLIYGTRN